MTTTDGSNQIQNQQCPGIICIGNLHRPFELEEDKYEIFDELENCHGVYIFVDHSFRALYVGKAATQSLSKRIKQNYTQDSGGTFRKNFAKESGEDCEDVRKELCIFRRALNGCDWRIVAIRIRKGDGQELTKAEKSLICILESALIAFLNPCYNKT